jgi:hypothetical protein
VLRFDTWGGCACGEKGEEGPVDLSDTQEQNVSASNSALLRQEKTGIVENPIVSVWGSSSDRKCDTECRKLLQQAISLLWRSSVCCKDFLGKLLQNLK